MNYIIFDTETTGLKSNDEVIQFSAIVCNSAFRVIGAENFFSYSIVSIDPGAQAVHGISREKLYVLSGGKGFEEQFYKFTKKYVTDDTVWIGYNISFDKRLINQTLQNGGEPPFEFGQETKRLGVASVAPGRWYFDAMKPISAAMRSPRSLKLADAGKALAKYYKPGQVEAMFDTLCKKIGVNTDAQFHSALYDSFVTFLLVYTYRNVLM